MTRLGNSIRRFLGVEEQASHYHIDVFVGETMRFLSGFLIRRTRSGDGDTIEAWGVYDHNGLLGERGRRLSDDLSLEEAMRLALAKLRELEGPPIIPVWNTAPYELLGYRLSGSPEKKTVGGQVGPDGTPDTAN